MLRDGVTHAIFVTEAYYTREKLYGVSGHVQIPLKAAALLSEQVGAVDLITTRPANADHLMLELPDTVRVRVIAHATREWPATGVYPRAAITQVRQLLSLVLRERYRVLHLFGGPKTGLLAALVKTLAPRTVVIYSPLSEPALPRHPLLVRMMHAAFRRLDRIVSTTEFVSQRWEALVGAGKTAVVRPGVLKPMAPPVRPVERDSVVFWRNADRENGADLMIDAVRELAPRHRDVRFVFALRAGSEFEADAVVLADAHENVTTYVQPYPDGLRIEAILERALLVVAPFRLLSINPQMAILESLYAGVPVVASPIESNPEVVRHGTTGVILDSTDAPSIVRAVDQLLGDRPALEALARNAHPVTSRLFNWADFGAELAATYESALSRA
jgi:glycosyltransferase involved in cell wall biosynthesis